MRACVALVVTSTLAFTSVARADTAVLATLVPMADARKTVAVGPTGQVYEPDGKGAWVRHRAGGIAATVTGAAHAGAVPIVEAKDAPPFKLVDGAWTAIFLAPKARAMLGAGSRVLAAAGKSVFALDGGTAKELPAVGARVLALAASDKRALVLTDKAALLELVGFKGSWTALKTKPPKNVAIRTLLSDQLATTSNGVLDLSSMKATAWPSGVRVDEVTATGKTVVALATTGRTKPLELLVLDPRAAAPAKRAGQKGANVTAPAFVREPTPLDGSADVVAIVVDAERRVVVATRDGRLAVRAAGAWDGSGAWTVTQVRDDLPATTTKAGSPPAQCATTATP